MTIIQCDQVFPPKEVKCHTRQGKKFAEEHGKKFTAYARTVYRLSEADYAEFTKIEERHSKERKPW